MPALRFRFDVERSMFNIFILYIDLQFDMSKPGIYIHIPFCVRKCLYCDFYSVADISLREPFVSALIREIESCEPFGVPPDTLYIGGGTPSVLDPESVEAIIEAVGKRFSLPSTTEITLEANPGTITPETLAAYRLSGINRINIGVQSFEDKALTFLGRCHDCREARQALEWARAAGFENVGLDLIYGLPEQNVQRWRETLAEGLSFQPEHFSCYTLTYEPGTPLARMKQAGEIGAVCDDLAADLFGTTLDVLSGAGYEHYEISNFARTPELKSRHNRKYWNHTPYTGFGPAAHSFCGIERRWNISDLSGYIKRIDAGQSPVGDTETLTRDQLMMETIYLGLRTRDGIDLNRFEARFGVSFPKKFSSLIRSLSEENLLILTDTRCALTERGMRFHDHITARFVDEMEET